MHNYKQLNVWAKALDLVVDIYKTTFYFPTEEKYGLISQMRKCAVSIPSNIAEGAGRNSDKEFCHFLSVANGSSYELETQVIVANRLELCEDLCQQLNEIQKMNYSLQQRLTQTEK